MSKHTKGPWKAIYGYPYGIIIQANGKRIANTSPTNKNWEADGKLLEATPDLLRVAKEALEHYENLLDYYNDSWWHRVGVEAMCELLRETIAQAEGGNS